MATPKKRAPARRRPRKAKAGTVFFLYDEPKKEWLAWAPKIAVPAEK